MEENNNNVESLEQVMKDEEQRFSEYLNEIGSKSSLVSKASKRSFCCNTSRSLYCSECYKVLIPQEIWPKEALKQLQLPFKSMDIILGRKERRNSSSGIQLMSICHIIEEMMMQGGETTNLETTKRRRTEIHQQEQNEHIVVDNDDEFSCWWQNVTLYDLNRGESIPTYNTESNKNTFVLFPSKTSVPISSVANQIEKLVVLDIKWTRSGLIQLHPSLSKLQSVHLQYPPSKSQFWRWHTHGDGMLSTLEAIYFASIEVATTLQWTKEQRNNIIHITRLFALQRSTIINQQKKNNDGETGKDDDSNKPLPFTTEGKNIQRSYRKIKDG